MVGYYPVRHLGTVSVIVHPHADHLDHQDFRTNSDGSVPGAPLVRTLTLIRTAGDHRGCGLEIPPDKVLQVVSSLSGYRHWKLQAIFDIAAVASYAAVLTGPLPFERHPEQPIDGYVANKSLAVKRSALCDITRSLHHYKGMGTYLTRSIVCGSLTYLSMLVKPMMNSWGSCIRVWSRNVY